MAFSSSSPLRWLPIRTPTLLSRLATPSAGPTTTTMSFARALSTTASLLKGGGGAKGGRKKNQAPKSEYYARVKILKQNMFTPAPPPLRMARLRHLRHWTIHRAWLLFRRQRREDLLKERTRMQAGMFNACEELRRTVGPGDKDEGYLYRVAMEKKGVWHQDAIPIEYARFQTDYPGEEPWNHEWKR